MSKKAIITGIGPCFDKAQSAYEVKRNKGHGDCNFNTFYGGISIKSSDWGAVEILLV